MLVYAEPTVADDSKMKDSGVDADALIDSRDLTGTYTECTAGIYTINAASYINHFPSFVNVCISSCW